MKDTKHTVLSMESNQALRQLISISQDLIRFAEEESQSLIMMDHMKFAFAQTEKEKLADIYAKASEEFRGRIETFHSADKGLIARLNSLQNQLKELTESNNVMIAQIKKRAEANTQTTLFTAQQMGQRVQIHETEVNEKTHAAGGL